ncbi:MAG: GntR family transcriptional regulator [Synergistaceae bacterium]|nr:GntR family transcriptional regulator [Synergistaceae bacterium]
MQVEKLSAEDRAYRDIIQLILSGQFRPGDFLLEVDLAPRLEMSRTPVSRALGRLVAEGFLNKMPKKGCYIPFPSPEDAEQVFYARMAVESEAAASAARKATDQEIRKLKKLLRMDEEAVTKGSKDIFAQINEQLHLGIAKASRNAYLEKWVVNSFWRSNIYIFYFDSFYKTPDRDNIPPQRTPEQHAAIVKAIEERNPEEAAARMREHVRNTYELLLLGR